MSAGKRIGSSSDQEGYAKSLGSRQIQMIAFGGAIGVGLFLGTGRQLHEAGPALVVTYLVAGTAAFLVMRALGELVMHRPVSGSFVTYAREFIGPWAGFASGWMYWGNWAVTGIAEITAIALYVNRWAPNLPQWATALGALAMILGINLVSVRLFAETEFWLAIVKVAAILIFLAVGVGLVLTNAHVGDDVASVSNLVAHGGFFPQGLPIVFIALQAVIFAYASVEMVGIAAGETRDPQRVLPRAINGVMWRVGIFYVGSVLLLAMVLPWTAYAPDESPFVTVFSRLGIPVAGDIMNLVVLTAAISGCSSGLYSTGRILRTLAQEREAPQFAGRLNSRNVPHGGILITAAVFALGVGLNAWLPGEAFDIAIAVASLGVISTWVTLLVCQLRMRAAAARGELTRPSYRMPGAPWSGYVALVFLGGVVLMMGVAGGTPQRIAFWSLPVIALVLWGAWRTVSHKRAAWEQSRENAEPDRAPAVPADATIES